MKSVPNWFCNPNSSNDLEYKFKKDIISGCIIFSNYKQKVGVDLPHFLVLLTKTLQIDSL